MENESAISGQFVCTKTSTVDLHILVVDDDATSLSIVSAMLRTLKYAAVTVRNATDALATLRVQKFDLIVTDLHMPEMNGLELQKRVKEEFKLPVIVMSADDEKSVIIKSLHRGAVFYMVKPVSLDDLRHVWQYAILAKKDKSVVIKEIISIRGQSSNMKISYEDISSTSSSSVNGEKRGKMDSKRKAPKLVYEDEDEDSSVAPKKAKVVWTTSLHNRFLQAIRHLTLEKAVPKRILEFMNVPGLTRENVASHLQKYRIFLKRVADKGSLSSRGLSDRSLRSSFASGLPSFVMRNTQAGYPRLPQQQQTRTSMFQSGLGIATWDLNTPLVGPRPFPPKATSSFGSLPQPGYGQLFSAPNKEASNSSLVPQLGNERWHSLRSQANLQQPLFNNRSLLHRANRLASEPNSLGSSFPSQGNMPDGTRNATNGFMKGINSVQAYPQKARPIGVRNPDYVSGKENMGSLNSCNPATNTRSTNGKYAGIEMNSGGKLVVNGHSGFSGGVENELNNGHGLMNGHNANMTVAPLVNLSSSYMARGGSSSSGFESANQWAPVLNTANQQENAVPIQPRLQKQYGVPNGGENDCASEYAVQQLGEDDLIDLFLEQNRNPALEHRVAEVNPLVNEFQNSELYGSSCFEDNEPLGEPFFAKHENGRRLVDSDELYGMYQVENTSSENHPFINQGWEEEFMDSSIFGHSQLLMEREAGEDLNPAGENLFYLS